MEKSCEKLKRPKTSKSRRETAVQGTNDSSIVSKCSMASLGYFEDFFLQKFVSKVTRRAPLIHRGYYVRAKVLDYILKKFLESHNGQKQIVSLGAGFDSAFFRLHSQGLLHNVVFVEVDFPEVVRRKCAIIKTVPEMLEMVGERSDVVKGNSPHIELVSKTYKLLGVDLSQTTTLEAALKMCDVNFDTPTLLLSECVLTYMTRRCASAVVKWTQETFNNSMFVLYEQVHPSDAFGLFMQKHFHTVGSPLKSIQAFPTVEDQKKRFDKLGWCDVEALDMNQFYYKLLTDRERDRVEKLEMFDEYEEWHLKCAHYMVLCGHQGACRPLLTALHTDKIKSKDVPEQDNMIHLTWPTNQRLFKRFGHGTVKLRSSLLLCVGGFGEQNGKHMRVTDMTLVDLLTMETENISPGVDNKTMEVSRMHSTVSGLKDGRILLIGGRLSPMKLCSQVVELEVHVEKICDKCQNATLNQSTEKSQENKGCVMKCDCSELKNTTSLQDMSSEFPRNCEKFVNDNLSYSDKENADISNQFPNLDNCESVKSACRKMNCSVDSKSKPVEEPDLMKNVMNLNLDDEKACETMTRVKSEILNTDGDIPSERWRHTAIDWIDDQGTEYVTVFGGRNQTVMALGDCYSLNTASRVWTLQKTTGLEPVARQSHSASFWNGHMIIAGGLDHDLQPLNSVHLLHLTSRKWSQLTCDINARYSHTATVIGDFLALVGGVSFSAPPPGVALIHIPSGISGEYAFPPTDRGQLIMLHRHTSVALDDGRILLLGGGGNCFSFGTHLNSSPVILDISRALADLTAKVKHGK